MEDYKWHQLGAESVQFMNNNFITVICMVWKEGDNSYGYVIRDVLNADSPIQVSQTRVEGHAKTIQDAKQAAMDGAIELSPRSGRFYVG